MLGIERSELPESALLRRYLDRHCYTDCYTTTLPAGVAFEDFVSAFYTTWLFRLERWLLARALKRPSTDEEADALAHGWRDAFAAWTVEDRADNQLLMCDMHGNTRSWFMLQTSPGDGGDQCRLYFGSAVERVTIEPDGSYSGSRLFRAALGFHKAYSVMLLRAARSRLRRSVRRVGATL